MEVKRIIQVFLLLLVCSIIIVYIMFSSNDEFKSTTPTIVQNIGNNMQSVIKNLTKHIKEKAKEVKDKAINIEEKALDIKEKALDKIATTSDYIDDKKPHPLIVLFTTFGSNTTEIKIYNTIREWASLRPLVQPVLYFTDNRTHATALQRGWEAIRCPKIADRISPSCVLPAMFLDAEERFPNADFYGYANGDLLFDDSLVNTLKSVKESLVSSKLLIIGCRFNYQMNGRELILNAQNVTSRKSKAYQFTGYAIDYFITPRQKYVWKSLPPLVVGRTLYDNYMIAFSVKKNIPVLDTTKTILALHQTTSTNFESRKGKKDHGINGRVITGSWKIEFDLGRVGCSHFVTSHSNGTVVMKKREKLICAKSYEKEHINIDDVRNMTVFKNL